MKNRYEVLENRIVIYLGKRSKDILETIIDLQDLSIVSTLKGYWWAHPRTTGNYYVRGLFGDISVSIHRLVMNPPNTMEVDHRDGNSLDNRRLNLRICTHQQNGWNSPKKGKLWSLRGVSYDSRNKKWQARIEHNKRSYSLGSFETAEEAARAYDKAALKLRPDFARLNFENTACQEITK